MSEQVYTEGDVNHYVQPVIGILRMREAEGRQLSKAETANAIERLTKACDAERAWLALPKGDQA